MSKEIVQTLEDIARLANVSKSTVSRALNNSPLLNQETKERIQSIAREHHFHVNATARNLRLRQSHTVAFVAPDYSPEFFSGEDLFGQELLSGVGRGLRSLDYDLLIIHVDPRDTVWAHDYLDSGRVDGFVLMTSNLKLSLIKSLVEMNAPFIGWGTPVLNLNYCSVSGDNIAGGLLATRHLIRSGRQRIAFLGGPDDSLTVQHRFKGYENALQAAGYRVDPHLYDDLPIAIYNNLPLTTIRQNIPLAGKLLAQNLIQYIQTGIVNNVTIPVELISRSTA
jgi:DNA-binding LacI/PurR family transcriptional regulator